MKPAPFEYHAPTSAPEALEMLDALPGATPLAGGQSLIPLLNLRLARPAHLVDLAQLGEFVHIDGPRDQIVIGAMTTHRQVERSSLILGQLPLLAHALAHVGFPAIRGRGTMGGSLAHADPAAELPAVALALDAEITLCDLEGTRVVAADDFFLGLFSTARRRGELIRSVTFPTRFDAWGFAEFARRTGDFAVVAVAVAVSRRNHAIREARVAIAGVADRPLRLPTAEAALVGTSCDEATVDRVATMASELVEPFGDIHGSPQFRRRLVRIQLRNALLDTKRRLGGD